ncbi:MAG: hypothetical protein WDO24_01375 [Pseudomonadota bacterium]
MFGRGVRGELGRGGRYLAGAGNARAPEPATGFSLFMDTVLRAVPEAPMVSRVFLPHGTPLDRARALRDGGWVTRRRVRGRGRAGRRGAPARLLPCLADGAIVEVETKS